MGIIKAADILLPDTEDMSRWSVIACDQFTSDRAYWEQTRELVGDAPSTLNMILPEAFIGTAEAGDAQSRVSGYMREYLSGGVFRELSDREEHCQEGDDHQSRKNNFLGGLMTGGLVIPVMKSSIGSVPSPQRSYS